jgi:hypothetical protein
MNNGDKGLKWVINTLSDVPIFLESLRGKTCDGIISDRENESEEKETLALNPVQNTIVHLRRIDIAFGSDVNKRVEGRRER